MSLSTMDPVMPDEIKPALRRYPVLSPLKNGGKRYSPDDKRANTVLLADEEAAALQEIGVIGEAKAGKEPAKE